MAGLLEKMAIATIKDDEESEEFALLDTLLLNTPSVAVERSKSVVNDMARLSLDSFKKATGAINSFSDEFMQEIKAVEKSVDKYEDKLGDYLVQLAQHSMSNDDSAQVNKILHVISDFEFFYVSNLW